MRPSFDTRGSLTTDFDAIRISLASPEKILSWSHGEVTKPETMHVILAVTDQGAPALTRYQRVIITIYPA